MKQIKLMHCGLEEFKRNCVAVGNVNNDGLPRQRVRREDRGNSECVLCDRDGCADL